MGYISLKGNQNPSMSMMNRRNSIFPSIFPGVYIHQFPSVGFALANLLAVLTVADRADNILYMVWGIHTMAGPLIPAATASSQARMSSGAVEDDPPSFETGTRRKVAATPPFKATAIYCPVELNSSSLPTPATMAFVFHWLHPYSVL